MNLMDNLAAEKFQSTLPLRGATRVPPSLVGAKEISIHTPLAGSDAYLDGDDTHVSAFQSTLPLRGATIRKEQTQCLMLISIHTPLAGSDQASHNAATTA